MNYPYSSPARTLASSGHSASSPASRSPLPASSAAALAALSRSTGSLSLEDNSKPMYWEKKAWFRLIDDELIAKSKKSQAIETLDTITTLVKGVKALPEDSDGTERERTIRLRNARIKTHIVEVTGAYDLLIQCGFKRFVTDFEEHLTFSRPLTPSAYTTAQSRLSTSFSVLTTSLDRLRHVAELENISKEAAKEENERRMKGVLEEIKEDRRKHKESEERRKTGKKRNEVGENMRPVTEAQEWH
ncbi:hypothetical protein JCM5353_002390 [Sporobolomyces roseus]